MGDRRHHAYAHGPPPLLCVAKADFKRILSTDVEFYEAMLWLEARRIRQLYGLGGRPQHPAAAGASWQATAAHLVRSYGIPSWKTAR